MTRMHIWAQLLILLYSLTLTTAAQVSGIFTSFNSLTWKSASNYRNAAPNYPTWTAVLGWSLDGAKVNPGDTFTLTMPCVFKFITTQTSVDLSADGVSYATCQLNPGEILVTYSTLTCTVNSALRSNMEATGTLSLPLSFNVGGSGGNADVADASCFKVGQNTVTFTDGSNSISTTANFKQGDYQLGTYDKFINYRLIPSLNEAQHYMVSGPCAKGYVSGTIGLATSDSGSIDCSNWHVGYSNDFNEWAFPKSFSSDYTVTSSCSSSQLLVSFKNVPAGYRPFIDALFRVPNGAGVKVTYINTASCVADTKQQNWGEEGYGWGSYQNGEAGANGIIVVLTTSTILGSTTGITTLPFSSGVDKTKTIEIIQPIPTTTVTTSHYGVSTSLITFTNSIGGTATVIVDKPYHSTTTLTTFWTGTRTATSTITNPTSAMDTVIVNVPKNPTVTTTAFWTGSIVSTTTKTNGFGGTDTVIVEYPSNPTVTTSVFWTGTGVSTTTKTNVAGGTNTVIVEYPTNPTVTRTTFWTGSSLTTVTATNQPGGTDSVIVEYPSNPTTT
ncbi:Agglutinin-like protein 9, partial [Candida parapsilosis]